MDNIVIQFKTIQGSVIRNLFESTKEVLTDVNLIFDAEGIRCTAIDSVKVACIYFMLEADKFEQYTCNEEQVVIGVSMQSFYKLIKTITNSDTFSIVINEHDRHRMKIIIENPDKHSRTVSMLKLLDIDQEIITIPNISFDNIVTMPCSDFQRYCKDMMTISHVVTLSCKPNAFMLSCNGDFADQVIEIYNCQENTNNMSITSIGDGPQPDDFDISGRFSLKYINLFIKSSPLCSTVEIYLKKCYPLVLIYHVGSLGTIKYCLAPDNTDS